VRCITVSDREEFRARVPWNHACSVPFPNALNGANSNGAGPMNDIIYLVGLIVVILAVLSLVGLR
jgi:hypothetical protein